MKNILFLLAMIVALPAFPKGMIVDASANTIPIAFDATAGSKMMECMGSSELEVYNNTSAIIAIGLSEGTVLPATDHSIVPDGPGQIRIYKAKGTGVLFGSGTVLYIRAAQGSTITTGDVAVTCIN